MAKAFLKELPDRHARFSVTFNGEVIVASARDPEHDACRALLARDITGRVQFYTAAGTPSLTMDFETAARRVMSEEDRDGLRLRKFTSRDPDTAPYSASEPSAGAPHPANTNTAGEQKHAA